MKQLSGYPQALSMSAGVMLVLAMLPGIPMIPLRNSFEQAAREGEAPALVTSASIRPFVRSLVERFRSQTTVLSQAEIHPRAVEDSRQCVIAVAQISPRGGETFSPQATDLSDRAIRRQDCVVGCAGKLRYCNN